MRRRQVLFIQAAGDKRAGSGPLIAHLERALAGDFEVIAPDMPTPDRPQYAPWRDRIAHELAVLVDDDALLVGHSLGGSVLVKCLAEGAHPQPLAGLFLVAAPYWGANMPEFALPAGFAARLPSIAATFLYHSRGDGEVPFSHVERYREALTHATVRPIDGDEHTFAGGLPALVEDLVRIGLDRLDPRCMNPP